VTISFCFVPGLLSIVYYLIDFEQVSLCTVPSMIVRALYVTGLGPVDKNKYFVTVTEKPYFNARVHNYYVT